MAQNYIEFDGVAVVQPDSGLDYSFETTYSEDSKRGQTGVLNDVPMFTVEAFSYHVTDIPLAEASKILKIIVGRHFKMKYLSSYYGGWRTDEFYVGKGSLSIGSISEGGECIDELSFNIVGVNPI